MEICLNLQVKFHIKEGVVQALDPNVSIIKVVVLADLYLNPHNMMMRK
jgi:hypothetical protein